MDIKNNDYSIQFVFTHSGEIYYEMLLSYNSEVDGEVEVDDRNVSISLTSVIKKLSNDMGINFMNYDISEIQTHKSEIRVCLRSEDVPLVRMMIIDNIIK